MSPAIITEIVGIIASILVFVSYVFTNQTRLRIVNLVACIIFIVYGVALLVISSGINGWSTVLLNSASAVIHIVWLVRIKKSSAGRPEKSIEDSEKSKESE